MILEKEPDFFYFIAYLMSGVHSMYIKDHANEPMRLEGFMTPLLLLEKLLFSGK